MDSYCYCYNFTIKPTEIVPVAFYLFFPTTQPLTMTDSSVALGLSPEGTKPPPPPNPDKGLYKSLPKCYIHPKLSLPAVFYLPPPSESSLLLTKPRVANSTSVLRQTTYTMASSPPCATLPVLPLSQQGSNNSNTTKLHFVPEVIFHHKPQVPPSLPNSVNTNLSNRSIQNLRHYSYQYPNLFSGAIPPVAQNPRTIPKATIHPVEAPNQIPRATPRATIHQAAAPVQRRAIHLYYQMEEARLTSNQQVQEEWAKIHEQQQQIHAMMISIPQPNATTMSTHSPLTLNVNPPSKLHNPMSQSPNSQSFC
jgi:hypothetical protein